MGWSGRKVASARAYWRPSVLSGGVSCWRCGRAIVPDLTRRDEGWTVGHLVDRADGGSETDPANQWPEHPVCNFRAGGVRGAATTNARRRAGAASPGRRRMEPERVRGIRGW